MKRLVWALTLAAATLAIPAQAFAQKVNVDFDPAAQFAAAFVVGRVRPQRLADAVEDPGAGLAHLGAALEAVDRDSVLDPVGAHDQRLQHGGQGPVRL